MRKITILLLIVFCSAFLLLGAAAAPAQAATFPFPVCGHNLPVLQESNCGAWDAEMGFVRLVGHDLTVNGSVGNISNHNVTLAYIPLRLVIFAWPNRWRVLAVGHPTASELLLPAWEQPFQTVFHLPRIVHNIGIYWIVPGTGGKFFSWHVHV